MNSQPTNNDCRLTLIIPVKDDERLFDLLGCLTGCENINKVHVLIACNGATHQFADRVKSETTRLPSAEVIEREQPGIAAALNAALNEVKTPTSFVIDSDCMIDSRFLGEGLNAASQGGSFRVNINYTGEGRFARMTADWRNNLNRKFNNRESFYNPGLGIAMMDFQKIGAYRTDIKHSFDSEFSDRASKLGIKCRVVPQAILVHRCHEDIRREFSIWKSYGFGRYQRMTGGSWPETRLKKYQRAFLGDVPDSFPVNGTLQFLYTLTYICIRATGLVEALVRHASRAEAKKPSMPRVPQGRSCRFDQLRWH